MNLLTRKEAAAYLRISVRTLDRLASNAAVIPLQRSKGYAVLYRQKDLDDYIAQLYKNNKRERRMA